jgi:SsrA-binding protein
VGAGGDLAERGAKANEEVRDIATNRRARFEYEILDTFEAGVALVGSEVKSARASKVQLQDAHVILKESGAWLLQCHIAPYAWANRMNHDPLRQRQLLLHRHELDKLRKGMAERGYTIIPLRIFFRGSRIKLEIALAKGKKMHDKRASIQEREAKRDLARGNR